MNKVCVTYKLYKLLSRHSTQLSKITKKYLDLRESIKLDLDIASLSLKSETELLTLKQIVEEVLKNKELESLTFDECYYEFIDSTGKWVKTKFKLNEEKAKYHFREIPSNQYRKIEKDL